MSILEWLNPYRTVFTCLLLFCTVVNNYLWLKHVNAGKARADDFGYFLRLWREGHRDGIIVMSLSIGAVVSGGFILAILTANAGAASGSTSRNASGKIVLIKDIADSSGKTDAICARPEYPKYELERNHEGIVTFRFLLGVNGVVKQALIHKSSGYRALDEAALDGLSKCRFKPIMADGKIVEGWLSVQYVWKP